MTSDAAPASLFAPNPALKTSQPRYMQLAQTLLSEIESGQYPVGSQLPTEYVLCEQFGVSRSTAREAVKRLVELGLVVRQPRIGTTVCARTVSSGYRQSVADVSDLYQYASETTLVIEARETVEIDAERARALHATAGETWLHLRGRRHAGNPQEPICTTEIWIHPAFRSIQGMHGPLKGAVHAQIEQHFGEVIAAVEQEIRAIVLTNADALALNAQPHTAALLVTRKYRNRRNQLVELATSIHPADRFSYSTILRREWGVGMKDR
ncbi:GntR family transcriptional regulator [Bordetella holmesii]|uniref:UbiC transcription regulator-associated domain protein n=2 Tax=Bordetella holmesii TaxID=35814 RepID=A0A158M712_9BORD|nr:GntR family transcriptional regulator [Bordetella holmesii]AMD44115.1 GntR family transcriptional regulator [Bordetella holmesii H558]AMD50346.1 GntR family transcriptional regulator [Bordetella holmesii F627]AOB36226.1 GntR family transcriptional regulator [Bordetella holmesii]AUL20197.1 GntR family transcriptional regulator [Bordetella holmesii]AUL23522.1 GntR family transcriptional regulator [Bordetella holmesii]